MRCGLVATCLLVTLVLGSSGLPAKEPVRLATAPALSPDGETLAFVWRGEIWLVSSSGGVARPWSTHPGRDDQPHFSPDGTRIAFTSERTGTRQVYVGDVAGGFATQVTFHSEGTSVEEWFPNGQSLLVEGRRDHSFLHSQRLFRVNVTKHAGEELLFDATAADGAVSPDGKKILFTREGLAWWRKGYRGSAGQPDLALRFVDGRVYQAGRRWPRNADPAVAARWEGILLCRRGKRQLQSVATRFGFRQGLAVDAFCGRFGRHAVHFS